MHHCRVGRYNLRFVLPGGTLYDFTFTEDGRGKPLWNARFTLASSTPLWFSLWDPFSLDGMGWERDIAGQQQTLGLFHVAVIIRARAFLSFSAIRVTDKLDLRLDRST